MILRALTLAFAPDADVPGHRVMLGLLAAAVVLPALGWLLSEDDEPLDLGGDD